MLLIVLAECHADDNAVDSFQIIDSLLALGSLVTDIGHVTPARPMRDAEKCQRMASQITSRGVAGTRGDCPDAIKCAAQGTIGAQKEWILTITGTY